jgi:hypothetical protein
MKTKLQILFFFFLIAGLFSSSCESGRLFGPTPTSTPTTTLTPTLTPTPTVTVTPSPLPSSTPNATATAIAGLPTSCDDVAKNAIANFSQNDTVMRKDSKGKMVGRTLDQAFYDAHLYHGYPYSNYQERLSKYVMENKKWVPDRAYPSILAINGVFVGGGLIKITIQGEQALGICSIIKGPLKEIISGLLGVEWKGRTYLFTDLLVVKGNSVSPSLSAEQILAEVNKQIGTSIGVAYIRYWGNTSSIGMNVPNGNIGKSVFSNTYIYAGSLSMEQGYYFDSFDYMAKNSGEIGWWMIFMGTKANDHFDYIKNK